jgi:hypothetical protein
MVAMHIHLSTSLTNKTMVSNTSLEGLDYSRNIPQIMYALSFIKVFAQQFEGLNPFRNHPTLMVYLV